jgi:DNA-binding NarL/FixJ family response regulator
VFGLSNVIEAVQKQKPALLLFDISSWQKPMEKLFSELMELKSARSTRKIILSDSAGLDDMVTALDSGADDFLLKPSLHANSWSDWRQLFALKRLSSQRKKFKLSEHCLSIEKEWKYLLEPRGKNLVRKSSICSPI